MYESKVLDGEFSVYPGHPLVIAYIIINNYPNLEAALKKSENSVYCRALTDCNIPGAGGNVHSAIDFLVNVKNDMPMMDLAIARANLWWAGCDGQLSNPNLFNRWLAGQEQADRFMERLKSKLPEWPQNE